MKCKDLELTLEQDGLSPVSEAAQAHLASCSACQNLVTDIAAISNAAQELPAEVDPPEQLWVSLRAQLEAEGIIRQPAVPEVASWRETFAAFWQSRALATVTVGLAIAAAAALELRQTPVSGPAAGGSQDYAATAAVLNQQRDIVLASTMTSPVDDLLRDNLTIVDGFIADCERRVRQEPEDEVAREYLSGAYQQKAELLAAMMNRNGGGD